MKMKEEEGAKAGLADTLDCVVMGYYRGRGQRAKFGLGAFLVGIINNEKRKAKSEKLQLKSQNLERRELGTGNYVTVSKIGTGLTDEQFGDLYSRLKQLEVKSMPDEYVVDRILEPDVWVRPELVVEIAADNITTSKVHTSGYSLRFPRLVRLRDDKSSEQASTIEEIRRLYNM